MTLIAVALACILAVRERQHQSASRRAAEQIDYLRQALREAPNLQRLLDAIEDPEVSA